MAEYVRLSPDGPWHVVSSYTQYGPLTACWRQSFISDEFTVSPGDRLCKDCEGHRG